MNQGSRDARKDSLDQVGMRSGSVMVDDDDRVYVAAGDVVAGKYRIERVLGVGGMGFVVSATHLQLEGMFALKFLKRRFLQDTRVVDRFTREAKAACRIRSDYVARVFDVGTMDDAPFLVMDYLVGRDLAAVLAEHGRLGVEEAVEYVVQACAALAAAHSCGVVHRDIKPENLFLVESDGVPTIKLLDFGISRIALTNMVEEPGAHRLTGAVTLGTPLYMSPEQIRETATAGVQSDLWSLGVVLYELLTGTSPFIADSVHGVCAAILENQAPSLLQALPDAPAGLADIVECCLRKNPAERYRNIAELAVALLGFAPARSLAVAEGSPSIRRAAIQALGIGPDGQGRARGASLSSLSLNAAGALSGMGSSPSLPGLGSSPSLPVMGSSPSLSGPVSSPSLPGVGPLPSRGPSVGSATFASAPDLLRDPKAGRVSRKRYWAAAAMALVGVTAVAVIVSHRSSAPTPLHTETPLAFTDVVPPAPSAASAPLAKETLAPRPSDDRTGSQTAVDVSPARPSPVVSQVQPLYRRMPVPKATPQGVRSAPQPAANGAPLATGPSEAASPPPAPAMPVAPGRPDLGY